MKSAKLALCFALFSPALLSPVYARGGGHGGGGHAGGGGGRSIGSVGGGFRGGTSGGFRGGSGGTVFRGGAPGSFRGAPYYYGGRYYRGPGVYLGFGYPYYGYYGYGSSYYGCDPYSYGYDPYSCGYDSYAYPSYSVPPNANYGYSYPPSNAYPYPPSSGYPVPPPQYQQQPNQYQPQASAGAGQTDNYYLIAFKDHTIEPATSYKVDGDQIHWITREGQERQSPVSTIDLALTQKLNGDRGINFQIP